RVSLIKLLRQLAHATQEAVLPSTHELGLALKAADELWLIDEQGCVITGTPEGLVLDGTFETVFEQEGFTFDRSTGSFTLHEPTRASVYLYGDSIGVFWTRHALERAGYCVKETNGTALTIEVKHSNERYNWNLNIGNTEYCVHSISEMLIMLKEH